MKAPNLAALKGVDFTGMAYLGAAVIIVYVLYKGSKAVQAAVASVGNVAGDIVNSATNFATTTANPASNQNAIYKTVGQIAGTPSLGASAFEFFRGTSPALTKESPVPLAPGSVAERAWANVYGIKQDAPYPLAPGSVAERAWWQKYGKPSTAPAQPEFTP